jgi:hypothetical protein
MRPLKWPATEVRDLATSKTRLTQGMKESEMRSVRAVGVRSVIVWLVLAAMAIGGALLLSSCGGTGTPQAISGVKAYKPYRAEGGEYSMEVPVDWTLAERGGAGGFETTVAANSNNEVVVSKQILPPGLDAKLMRTASHDQAIMELVQAHYDSLEKRFRDFAGDAPQVGTAGSMTAGFGSFTAQRKAGIGGKTVEVNGATALLIGLNNLYIVDAFADPASADIVGEVFDKVVNSFKAEE